MGKTINPKFQPIKQKLKNFLDLKLEDRRSFLFEKENPDFPVTVITNRFSIGLTAQAIARILSVPIKEGSKLVGELGHFNWLR